MPSRRPKKAASPTTTPTRPVSVSILLSGYEDGTPYTDRPMADPANRWDMQAADRLTVRIGAVVEEGGRGGGEADVVQLSLSQDPKALATHRAGVGAVVWPGAVALAAALVSSAQGWWVDGGAHHPPRVLELGAGAVGLPSLVFAALGGCATATDRSSVLPLLQANVDAVSSSTGGRVAVAALDWGGAGAAQAAAALAAGLPDNPNPIIAAVASDCVYHDAGDPAGSPDARVFVNVLCAAMGAGGGGEGGGGCPAWVAVEPRSTAALDAFVAAARAACTHVTRLALPAIVGGSGGGESGWSLDHIHLYELRL